MATAKRKGPCANADTHRKAQAKYVAKNKGKHAAAVKASYQKNRSKILTKKKAAGSKKGGGGSRGRPRKC